MPDFRVVAIVSAFNEADVISPVIGHLVENGVDVYLIDNHSTDGTPDEAKRWLGKGLLGIERFPAEPPAGDRPQRFDWEGILRRKEALAKELPADWFIHHDADEFREAPWPGMALRDAIAWVDRLGYNCIDFRVLNFPPLENGFRPGSDPTPHFTHWEDPVVYDTLQLKAWKAQKVPVSLASSGGHEARFPERRVFPIRFLLRHYPIRGQEHGRRKVFDERKKRFLDKERAKGWHVQYDAITEAHSFLGDPERLHAYDPARVRLELMLENERLREAERRARELALVAETTRLELAGALASKHQAEKHGDNLERDRQKILERGVDRERHITNLESLKAQLERHSTELEKERDRLATRLEDRERHAANLEGTVGHLQHHASGLERDREKLARYIEHLEEVRGNLEDLRAERERHIGHLEAARAEAELHAADLAKRIEQLTGELERSGRARARLEDEIEQQTGELERSGRARATLEDEKARAEAALFAIQTSRTWRLTAPLRRILDRLKTLG